jgi:transposase
LVDQHAAILSQVEAHQDATLDELRAWLKETHGVTVSMGLMWNTLARLGLTLKTYGPPRLQAIS